MGNIIVFLVQISLADRLLLRWAAMYGAVPKLLLLLYFSLPYHLVPMILSKSSVSHFIPQIFLYLWCTLSCIVRCLDTPEVCPFSSFLFLLPFIIPSFALCICDTLSGSVLLFPFHFCIYSKESIWCPNSEGSDLGHSTLFVAGQSL